VTPAAAAVVLVVDDEPRVHETVERHLTKVAGIEVAHAHNAFQARELLEHRKVDVILLDLDMPGEPGDVLLGRLRGSIEAGRFEVMILTAIGTVDNAFRCARLGAFDYVTKSADAYLRLGEHVTRALAHRRYRRAALVAELRDEARGYALQLLRSRTPEVQTMVASLTRLARSPGPVLLETVPGMRPELVARFFHDQTAARDAPFVRLDTRAVAGEELLRALGARPGGTGALTPAAWELAEDGVLLVDDLDHLEGPARDALARLFDEERVRLVLVASPDAVRELKGEPWVRARARLARLVPLAERRDDLPMLLHWWSEAHPSPTGRLVFSDEAAQALAAYDWPRNHDELDETLLALQTRRGGARIELMDLPLPLAAAWVARRAAAEASHGQIYERAVAELERALIRNILEEHGGSVREASAALGISYAAIRRLLARLGWEGKTDDDH
jgi:DNA-binding NtrC family response regulator